MSTQNVIDEIDALLTDTHVERAHKRFRLRQLAREYWKAVFPEYGTPMFAEIPSEAKEHRWRLERAKNELARCFDATAVMRVLDSPASGDPLR